MKDIFSQTLPFNFLGLTPDCSDYSESKVAILPVCYDSQSTGTAEAPWAILKASRFMDDFHSQLKENFTELGLCTLPSLCTQTENAEDVLKELESSVAKLIHDEKFVVLLGGENTITLGAAKAFSKHCPQIGILHLGSRANIKDSHKGNLFHPSTTIRRLKEICPVVQAGIRAFSQEEHSFLQKQEQKTFYSWSMKKESQCQEEISASLPDNIYISINLDVFDSSIMPSVRIPEPGGLRWHEVQDLLTLVSKSHKILGFDITGLCPIPGFVSPDYLAAKLAYFLIGLAHTQGVVRSIIE
ncbi:MAG: arginase family protein [Candidatus Brocadiae bacterium]|nr:arginase family protein [Candidatus Brocadiia bacterium]